MNTVTGTARVWISDTTMRYESMPDLNNLDPETMLSKISIVRNDSDMSTLGWTEIGTAEVTVHVVDNKDLAGNQIKALKAIRKEIMSRATAQCTEIDSKINDLLALSYDGESA